MILFKNQKYRADENRAFTLVEILIVLALIVFLTAIFGIVFKSGTSSQGLRTSENILASLIQATRAQAILKGSTARLIIYNDSTNDDKYHRFLGIIYSDAAGGWIAANEGVYLPEGIYFNEEISINHLTMSIEFFPQKTPQPIEDLGTGWIYFEFNSAGLASNTGGRIVLGVAGKTDYNGGLIFNADNIFGFQINQTGNFSKIADPAILKLPPPVEDADAAEEL